MQVLLRACAADDSFVLRRIVRSMAKAHAALVRVATFVMMLLSTKRNQHGISGSMRADSQFN